MLTVAKVTAASAQGYAEYLEGKAQPSTLGDYYLKDGDRVEAPGRWASDAAAVGCDTNVSVSGEQLRLLLAVRRPDTGKALRAGGAGGEAVAAIDATFSAPKSVSAAWAVAGPELRAQIEHAHETAIDRALTYSVQQVPMVRHRMDRDTVIHTKSAGVVATSWRHTTARTVGEQAADPQLHSHVLLHAAVRRDGKVVAIDSRKWLVHRREVGAAYRTELAYELTQLGFAVDRQTGRGGRYFELAGIPHQLTDRWSSRHHQVQAAITGRLRDHHARLIAEIARGGPDAETAARQLRTLLGTGQLSPKEERSLSTLTRSAKGPITHHDLDEAWQHTAHRHGLDPMRLAVLRAARPHLAPATTEAVMEGLTEFDATFPAWDARAVALEHSTGIPVDQALQPLRQLSDGGQILRLADGTGTTHRHRATERITLVTARRVTMDVTEAIPAEIVTQQAERLDAELAAHGGRLSDEQRHALQVACGDRRLVVIDGQAGTGKSTALTAIARAHQAHGQQIIVTSTAGLTAERLARELTSAGVAATPYSTVALQHAIHNDRVVLGRGHTIIHDEAALASTREQHALLTAIEPTGARLIEVGDPKQNTAVGAGGLWPHLEATTSQAGARVRLTVNRRAHDPADHRDQARFRSGQVELALRGYAARDRVHHHIDQPRAEDAALDAAQSDRQADKRTIVIAQTSNEHLDELNARAQAIRQQAGELGDRGLHLPGRPYQLHASDEIQIRHSLQHPDHGQLRNGTTAHVTEVDADTQRLHLELAGGDHVTLDRGQIDQADVRLAYVQHPFPAQGTTTDTAHLIASPGATHQGTYVALTRARHDTHIYAPTPEQPAAVADPTRRLAEHLSRTEPDLPSISTPLAREAVIATRPDHHQQHPTPTLAERQPAPEHVTSLDRESPTRAAEPRGLRSWAESRRQADELDLDRSPSDPWQKPRGWEP